MFDGIFQKGAFQIDPNATPEQLARKRAMMAAMMPQFGRAKYVGEGVGQALTGLSMGLKSRQMDKFEAQKRKEATDSLAGLTIVGGAYSSGGSYGEQAGQPSYSPFVPPSKNPMDEKYPVGQEGPLPERDTVTVNGAEYDMGMPVLPSIPEPIKQGIFAGESGGDYNALFGFQNRPGGRYANVKLTDMTVDQALEFANPQGDYGQWVKGKVGRVATPMGAYQVVGKTLREAKQALGLTGNERMTPELQDAIGHYIWKAQGTGAWEGYKGPRQGGSAPAAGPAPAGYGVQTGPSVTDLQAALANPWLSPSQKQQIQGMINTQQQQQQAMQQRQWKREDAQYAQQLEQQDPMYQAKLAQMTAPQPRYEVVRGSDLGLSGPQADMLFNRAPDGKTTQIGGGGTNISVNTGGNNPGLGKLSTDYGYVLDPETGKPVIDPKTGLPMAAPVPGSKAALEQKQAEVQKAQRAKLADRAGNVVIEDIDRALEQSNKWGTTGFFGGLADGIGGTSAHDLSATLQTIKGNIGFDRLQQMREASPTGGALGAVSERELSTLQSVLGSLEQSQTKEQLQRNLNRLKDIYGQIMRKAEAYPNAADYGFTGGSKARGSEETFEDFAATPSAQAAAKQYGVTLEEMWKIKQGIK